MMKSIVIPTVAIIARVVDEDAKDSSLFISMRY
jgi:hypothetical protein